MKRIFLFTSLIISIAAQSQVTRVSLQAGGLTCSMCSNAINKSLQTLDFVDKVEADLSSYTFEITFIDNSKAEFEKIKKKVEDAGFFVSGFVATINFSNAEIRENEPLTIGSNKILFIDRKDQPLNGEIKVKLVDKGFISSKEYKKKGYSAYSAQPGIYHVII